MNRTRSSTTVLLATIALTACRGDGGIHGGDEPVFLADLFEGEASPVILDKETRRTLAQDLPSRFTFDVRVPTNAVLRFSIATRPLGEEKHWPPIEFRVLVNGDEEPLFAETLSWDQAERFFDREVELSSWAGRRTELVLETRVSGPETRVRRARRRAMPLWGNPVLANREYRPERPNVVLVSIDCLRADHVGAYGYSRPTTPNIDALAEEGSVFQSASAVSSWTLPTHLSMLTGLFPTEHGVRRQQKLNPDVPFLPELLSRAGYHVDGVASWYYLSQTFGFDRGFHSYKLLVGHDAEEIVDTAIDLVRRGEGGSQFLFVHLVDPHWPYDPPGDWIVRFGRPRDITDVHDRIARREPPRDAEEVEDAMRLYDAEIAYADNQLGRLVDELKARSLYDNALIIVTADHGEAFYEHGHWQHTVSLYEEVTHIPLIVKWPRRSRSARMEAPVSQVDIFPTILDAVGAEIPDTSAVSLRQVGARSVVSELTSPAARLPRCDGPSDVERECFKLSVRADSMKYIAKLAEEDGALVTVGQELYDLSSDPAERHDLSEKQTSRVNALSGRIRAFLRQARSRARSARDVTLDEETTEQLRSLGYVQD